AVVWAGVVLPDPRAVAVVVEHDRRHRHLADAVDAGEDAAIEAVETAGPAGPDPLGRDRPARDHRGDGAWRSFRLVAQVVAGDDPAADPCRAGNPGRAVVVDGDRGDPARARVGRLGDCFVIAVREIDAVKTGRAAHPQERRLDRERGDRRRLGALAD